MSVHTAVITGGPCAGKTTGINAIVEWFSNIGYYPLVVPEVPTIFIPNGLSPRDNIIPIIPFQKHVIRTIMFLEDEFKKAASHTTKAKPIIICDRGVMDGKAYTPLGQFNEILASVNLDTISAFDRYDAVYHLRTTALGAEEYYTLANNSARLEDPELARINDEKTLQAWVGHPHVRVIDNSTDFEGKLKRLFASMCHTLGIPAPIEVERKFLIESEELETSGVPYQNIEIEQYYVTSLDENRTVRYRRRGQYGSYAYFKTIKMPVPDKPGERFESEERVSRQEYYDEKVNIIPFTQAIQKHRKCFVYNNQYFELDVIFRNPNYLKLLELELTDFNDKFSLPPFIKVKKEVTYDRAYTNRKLAEV